MIEKTMKMNKTFDVKSMVLCSLFASLSCIGAFIQIPLPNSDYFTLQYLFVMLTGMLLGSKRALISISSYVFMGLIGLPVFAAGGGIGYPFALPRFLTAALVLPSTRFLTKAPFLSEI